MYDFTPYPSSYADWRIRIYNSALQHYLALVHTASVIVASDPDWTPDKPTWFAIPDDLFAELMDCWLDVRRAWVGLQGYTY